MTVELALSKLHATGNDFLVLADLDLRHGPAGAPTLSRSTRARLCDRRAGVGGDGLIRILPPQAGGDCVMELTNADGGLAEISGNGLRCLAFVARRLGLGSRERLVVETAAGPRALDLELGASGDVARATADMGALTYEPDAIPVLADSPFGLVAEVDTVRYSGDAVGAGNPHFVVFVSEPDEVPLARHGPVLEHDPRFPRRTNVEMVTVDGDGVRMRVWERGVGETLSCGSGACAAAGAALRRGLVRPEVTVTVPGGRLRVEVDHTVRLGGPVTHVFDTTVEVPDVAPR